MAVEIEARAAWRIAELLDLFGELPSTPPVLTEEARELASALMDLIGDEDLRHPAHTQNTAR